MRKLILLMIMLMIPTLNTQPVSSVRVDIFTWRLMTVAVRLILSFWTLTIKRFARGLIPWYLEKYGQMSLPMPLWKYLLPKLITVNREEGNVRNAKRRTKSKEHLLLFMCLNINLSICSHITDSQISPGKETDQKVF